jgi:hypothetical protein
MWIGPGYSPGVSTGIYICEDLMGREEWGKHEFCSICDEPLEVVEMLSFSLDEAEEEDSMCDLCVALEYASISRLEEMSLDD